jgi:DNA-binding transcriptional LysR family regulator
VDWDDLKVFRAVASAGSLAGGARRVAVSQATAWRRVRALEATLRVALFDRGPTGYVLTSAGSALLVTADQVARSIDAARGRVAEAPDEVAGEVRVAAPEFVGSLITAELPALARRHPRLVVELLTGSPAAGLLVRDVDVAIRAERIAGAGFTLDAVYAIPFALYASAAYLGRHGAPAAIDDLAGHRLIAFDHSMAHVAPKAWLRSGGRGATIVFRSNSPQARLRAAQAGLGLAMLPEPLARGARGLRCALPAAAVGRLDLMLLVATASRRDPRVAAVRDLAAGALEEAARR